MDGDIFGYIRITSILKISCLSLDFLFAVTVLSITGCTGHQIDDTCTYKSPYVGINFSVLYDDHFRLLSDSFISSLVCHICVYFGEPWYSIHTEERVYSCPIT